MNESFDSWDVSSSSIVLYKLNCFGNHGTSAARDRLKGLLLDPYPLRGGMFLNVVNIT